MNMATLDEDDLDVRIEAVEGSDDDKYDDEEAPNRGIVRERSSATPVSATPGDVTPSGSASSRSHTESPSKRQRIETIGSLFRLTTAKNRD